MSNPPGNPHAPSPSEQARQQALYKIRFVCERITAGLYADQCREVAYYRWHTFFAVLLSSLGSAGLIKKQYDLSQIQAGNALTWVDYLTFILALLALLGTIILELVRAYGIDQTALQAISAKEAFGRLRADLENALSEEDPRPNLDRVYADAKTLWTSFHKVIKEPNPQEAQEFYDRLVAKYQTVWNFAPVIKKANVR